MKRIIFLLSLAILCITPLVSAEAIYENWTFQDDLAGPGPQDWRCEVITVGTTGLNATFTLGKIGLYLSRTATNGNLTVVVRNVTSALEPTGNNVSAGIIYWVNVSNGAGFYNITMSPATLLKGTSYAICGYTDKPGGATITMGIQTVGGYGGFGGRALQSADGGQTFTTQTYDHTFKVYDGGNLPANPLTVTLTVPTNNTVLTTTSGINFSAFATPRANFNLTNATLYIWNSTSIFNITTKPLITPTNQTNTTFWIVNNFPFGMYQFNVYACESNGTLGTCGFSQLNNTFIIDGVEYYEPNLVEGQTTLLYLNLSTPNIDDSQTAILNWNGTDYQATKIRIDTNTIQFRVNLQVPFGLGAVTGNPVSHYWNFGSGNTTSLVQKVYKISIDDCSVNQVVILNYTLADEDSEGQLNGTLVNGTIETETVIMNWQNNSLRTVYGTNKTNVNNVKVCVPYNALNFSSFRVDTTTRYVATNYVSEFHHLQAYNLSISSVPNNITLLDLLISRSQSFLITFKDANFLPAANTVVEIKRKYIGLTEYKLVEAPLTDDSGQTIAHLVLQDVIYQIIFKRNGTIIGFFDNQIAICQNPVNNQCTLNLNAFSGGNKISDFSTNDGISYQFIFDPVQRTLQVPFIVLDGSAKLVQLNVTKYDGLGNNTVCTDGTLSSTGTLSCSIPATVGNTSIYAVLTSNGGFVASSFFSLSSNGASTFGGTGGFLLVIMVITLAFMFSPDPIGQVIGAAVGLICGIILNIYTGASVLGLASAAVWLFCAIAIFIWSASRRNPGG